MNCKTLLIIENESISDLVLKTERNIKKHYEEQGLEYKCIKIDRLRYDSSQVEELKRVITTELITDILFYTTWVYWDSTANLYNIISKVPQSLTIWNYSDSNVSSKILDAIDINNRKEYNTYMSLVKHNVLNVNSYGDVLEFEEEKWITQSDALTEALEQIEVEEAKEQDLLEKNELNKLELISIMKSPTNHFVKILNISAFGKQWSNLREGDIVPILKTPSTDPSPNWGVWVAGLDEPVKIVNSETLEYEYLGKKDGDGYKLTAKGLAKEIVACVRNTGIEKNSMIGMLEVKINRINDSCEDESEIHEFLTYELLDFASIPRRKYRAYFEPKIKEYYNKHKYFSEISRGNESYFKQILNEV